MTGPGEQSCDQDIDGISTGSADRPAERFDERFVGRGRDALDRHELDVALEKCDELDLVGCGVDESSSAEACDGCGLMVVAVLAEIRSSGDDDERTSRLECCEDRPHSGVCHDEVGRLEDLMERLTRERLGRADVDRLSAPPSDLGEDLPAAAVPSRPPIDGTHEAVER